MDLAAFRTRYPEFGNVPDALITAVLAEALLELNETIFGDLIDTAQGCLTAHKLAVSPYGVGTKLVNKDGSTSYGVHFEALTAKTVEGALLL